MKKLLTLAVALSACGYLSAQSTLPSAPGPQLLSSLQQQSPAPMPQAPAGTAPAIPDNAALPPNLPELTLAQQWDLSVYDLAHNIHAHPTMGEAVKEAVHGLAGHMINM